MKDKNGHDSPQDAIEARKLAKMLSVNEVIKGDLPDPYTTVQIVLLWIAVIVVTALVSETLLKGLAERWIR